MVSHPLELEIQLACGEQQVCHSSRGTGCVGSENDTLVAETATVKEAALARVAAGVAVHSADLAYWNRQLLRPTVVACWNERGDDDHAVERSPASPGPHVPHEYWTHYLEEVRLTYRVASGPIATASVANYLLHAPAALAFASPLLAS